MPQSSRSELLLGEVVMRGEELLLLGDDSEELGDELPLRGEDSEPLGEVLLPSDRSGLLPDRGLLELGDDSDDRGDSELRGEEKKSSSSLSSARFGLDVVPSEPVLTYWALAQPPNSSSLTKPLRFSPTVVVSPRSQTPTMGADSLASDRTLTLEVQVPVPAADAVPAIRAAVETPAIASAPATAAMRRPGVVCAFIVGKPPCRKGVDQLLWIHLPLGAGVMSRPTSGRAPDS
ncbi:hypothetical protein EV383_3092 [Pseudonocardia sediminis]|uniref:Uncharacterized protein n=1 Tax=Pseudonocardia sediminis TaxID=1397368 RepID=A0A4Q7UW83_PSEST|nr:hypothetical protein EV383_3092 [Pseudonocardia sediminis]